MKKKTCRLVVAAISVLAPMVAFIAAGMTHDDFSPEFLAELADATPQEAYRIAAVRTSPDLLPSLNDPSKKIHSGLATFTRNLKVTKPTQDEAIHIKVDYQACNENYCLAPELLQETVTVPR